MNKNKMKELGLRFSITGVFPLKNTIEITLKDGKVFYYKPKFQRVESIDPIQLVDTILRLIK